MAGNTQKIGLNILLGYAVSLIGTLPLGYLNLLALHIYITQSLQNAMLFALGVVLVEVFAIRLTMLGAEWLLAKKQLMLYLELFSIAFMLAFAIYFFAAKPGKLELSNLKINNALNPLILGVIANALNFMQYPFWTGWNLYLIKNNKLFSQKPYYYWYLLSTMLGTFCGMMVFILAANYLVAQGGNTIWASLNIIFGGLFMLLGLFQAYKLYKKQKAAVAA